MNLELARLQTDYIDLYQLHWPERHTNTFGVRDFKPSPNDPWVDNFNEVLHALKSFVDAGKIRAIGLSNEKAWGAMRCAEEVRKDNLIPISTTQNAYSMLNRVFEGDLAEVSLRENIGLLAYSPLAFGVLSGKYIEGPLQTMHVSNYFHVLHAIAVNNPLKLQSSIYNSQKI